MARETKEQFAARVAHDNEVAASIPLGTSSVDPILGVTWTLIRPVGEQVKGWDLYVVRSDGEWGSDGHHSSASVAASFGKASV
jgi:hypothetical protein